MSTRRHTHAILSVLFVSMLVACDSTSPIEADEPVAPAAEETALEDQLVGLWEKDIGSATIGWLFKEGGVYHVGEPRPFFPVVGQWSVVGDTLKLRDPGCLDRARYRIGIGDGELATSVIDDSCGGRRATLEGTWRRFVYGQ